MKYIKGMNGILALILLIAGLIFPVGVNKRALANTCSRTNGESIAHGHKMTGGDEEAGTISVIRFYNWL